MPKKGEHTEKKSTLEGVSFEQGLQRLEELVEQVESGVMPLDQSLQAYEQGARLVAHLRKLLSGAEEKLRTLQEGIAPSDDVAGEA